MNSQDESAELFSEKLDRLKHSLRMSKDGEIAAALGLTKSAFSERKKRGAFPVEALYALSSARPELGLDVAYVLTGIPAQAQALLAAKQQRIERAVNAGASVGQVREAESRYAPESLGALVALLEQCNAVERASLHTLLTSMLARRSST